MDSFKVYLPSNACQFIYPNNKPSDYKTRFDNAIQLDGDWEVGAESVSYSALINNKEEKAQVYCNVRVSKKKYGSSSVRSSKYSFYPDVKWNRPIKITPNDFEKDPNNLEGVIQTLNNMNNQLVKNVEHRAFVFTPHSFKLSSKPSLKKVYVFITPRLAQVLGYKPGTILGRKSVLTQRSYQKAGEENLTQEDYALTFLNMDARYKQTRIEIKAKGSVFDGGEDAFLSLWKQTVESVNENIIASFKNKKLLIHNHLANVAIAFSPDFYKAIYLWSPIFEKTTTWGGHVANLKKGYSSAHWYIDIFSLEDVQLSKEVNYHFTVDVFPWQYDTVNKAMAHVNKRVKKATQEKLKVLYDDEMHRFELTLNQMAYSKLDVGSKINVDFSENLRHLFGLIKQNLENKTQLYGMSQITNLVNREEHLFLLSNIVKTTAYGQQHLPILQSFLHTPKNSPILTKRFEPIIYFPLISNYIDMVEIQLTNRNCQPVHTDDYMTIVCLYFRKVKEKTMM